MFTTPHCLHSPPSSIRGVAPPGPPKWLPPSPPLTASDTNPKSRKIQSSVIACPVCGSTTVKRTGRYGSFWGCSRYPGCHGTQPFKIDYAGQPCRHCRTPVVRQTHAKPPKPGRSYFAWWFKCPGCKALYLVEAARRFFDATDKGFIRFAAERAGGRKRSLDAANVRKPCSELNLD